MTTDDVHLESHASWRAIAVGDGAVLIEFRPEGHHRFDPSAHRSVSALDGALRHQLIDGVAEVVPALTNLMVRFDPLVTNHDAVIASLERLLPLAAPTSETTKLHTIEVCYDRSVAPDIDMVAQQCGLSVNAVIEAHLAGDYEVLMYGFAPGYAYLGGLPQTLAVPRKPTPVRGVAAGSVIIAGSQCLVTTLDAPTGWSNIGRSPTPLLVDDTNDPFPMAVGDRVEFHRIGIDALSRETEL